MPFLITRSYGIAHSSRRTWPYRTSVRGGLASRRSKTTWRGLRGVDSGKPTVADGDLTGAVLIDQEPVVRQLDERSRDGGAGVHDRESNPSALVPDPFSHPHLGHRPA